MGYEDSATRVNKLHKEYAIIRGMTDEIISSCLLLKQKVLKEKKLGMKLASEELYQEVVTKIGKFERRLNKYQHRLSQIEQEIKEIYGTNEF